MEKSAPGRQNKRKGTRGSGNRPEKMLILDPALSHTKCDLVKALSFPVHQSHICQAGDNRLMKRCTQEKGRR